MPSSTTQSHARSHALLLLQKLLNLRDSASPLTLVLDTLEQSGKPILREFMSRAQISKTKIIYISFATLRKPAGVDIFVRAQGKTAESLRSEIISHYPAGHTQKTLLIIDELNPLSASIPSDLALFLSSLITNPSLSLVALYHTDVPLSLPRSQITSYTPHPLTILTHLATAVLRTTNLHHAIERRRAQNRSQRDPEYGLDEGREGVIIGLGLRRGKTAAAQSTGVTQGLVVEMELRRRSGRAVGETFVLIPTSSLKTEATGQQRRAETTPSKLYLLSDHPAFAGEEGTIATDDAEEEQPESTFNLGLTAKQRRDREGIVLPYFDAQTDIGAGEGGRILYEMGREDDFDEEEDEI
ncbi:Elongator complex protein 5 [Xylaria bambusicola]|uniref:Elongator complex protein 5 n=1 Tax=Xylaria bambusicola TaxID=326684 RepID=UPI002007335A|nr:Elongator complex protein 5 [Xylaria bambusicola]KAI0517668.1 Elongator complex protein 5 [Xylaria bambusicola]